MLVFSLAQSLPLTYSVNSVKSASAAFEVVSEGLGPLRLFQTQHSVISSTAADSQNSAFDTLEQQFQSWGLAQLLNVKIPGTQQSIKSVRNQMYRVAFSKFSDVVWNPSPQSQRIMAQEILKCVAEQLFSSHGLQNSPHTCLSAGLAESMGTLADPLSTFVCAACVGTIRRRVAHPSSRDFRCSSK